MRSCRNIICSILSFVAILLSAHSAWSEELDTIGVHQYLAVDPSEEINANQANFIECWKIVDLLVDVPSGFISHDFEKDSLVNPFPASVENLGGSERFKLWRVASIVQPLVSTSKAKSIVRLGNIDSFLPVYITANKTAHECKQIGCEITVFQDLAGFSPNFQPPHVLKVVASNFDLDDKSYYQVSVSPHPSSHVLRDVLFMHDISSMTKEVHILGPNQSFRLYSALAKFLCYDRGRPENPECKTLFGLYGDGEGKFDEVVFLGQYSLPFYYDDIRIDKRPWSEKPLCYADKSRF